MPASIPARPQRDSEVIHTLWIALAAVVILAFGILFLRGVKRQQPSDDAIPQLSEAERLEALEHVRQWISGGAAASKNEATV